MDTILYFYQTAACPGTEAEEEGTGSLCRIWPMEYEFPEYLLVGVGLTAGQIGLLQGKEENAPREKRKGFELPWRRRRRRKMAERERRELLAQIEKLWGQPSATWCVCEPPANLFAAWGFTDYREEKWVERLMEHAIHTHFVVLGNADCLPYVLPRHAQRMKSLRFVLCEWEATEELEELLEELLCEYGIAATVRQIDDRADYRRLRELVPFPCNVLDFSGEEKISSSIVPAGSVWLDFSSDREKWRRMERQGGNVQYISLYKEWKVAVHRLPESHAPGE